MDFVSMAADIDDPNRKVGLDTVCGTEVSTVRLPVCLRPYNSNKPVWETCLFDANGDSRVMEQYSTHEDAVLGHTEWVNKVSNGFKING